MTDPRNYVVSNKVQKRNISSIIEEFAENLMDIHGKCMDVGCGPGDITKEILLPTLGSNAQIIGTDISESMIKYANEMFCDKKRLQFEVLDIETKNLPKKYISEFDHIFSFHTLQWCNDIRQALKNILHMLRPNGTLLAYIIASHDVFEVLRILARDIRFEQYMPDTMKYISPYQESVNARKELQKLLQSIGFTVHHCSLREASYSDKNSEPFLGSCIATVLVKNNAHCIWCNERKTLFICLKFLTELVLLSTNHVRFYQSGNVTSCVRSAAISNRSENVK